MIDYLTYFQICSLHKDEKLTAGQIARKLQLDKKTVRYWLRHPFHQHKRPNRSSKLEPYKPRVLQTSLSNEQEAKLMAALSKLAVPAAASA